MLLNKSDTGTEIKDFNGRIVINRIFPISQQPVVSCTISPVQFVLRYYDSSFSYLGTSYSSSAKFARIIIVVSDGTALAKSAVNGKTLTINGVTYELWNTNLPVSFASQQEIVTMPTRINNLKSDVEFLENSVEFLENSAEVLINKNDISGDIVDALGRVVVNRFFPITQQPTITSNAGYAFLRYYDSNYSYLDSSYSSSAKFVRVGIVVNDNVEIDYADIRGKLLSVNGYTYEFVSNLIQTPQSTIENIILAVNDASIVLLNKNNNGTEIEDYDGRISINRFFPISSEPTIICNIPSVGYAFRYYDTAFSYIGSSYTSSAKYVKIVLRISDGTAINKSVTYGKTLKVNDVVYSIDCSFLPLSQPFIEDISNQRKYKFGIELMQIFQKYTTVGDSLMAGYTSVDGVTIGSAVSRESNNNWVGYIEKRIGQQLTNLAIGSSTTHHWRYGDGPSAPEYVADINDANIKTDCYIIALGVNDIGQSVPVGTSADVKVDYNENGDSYYGNYDFIIRKLLYFNPYAHILCFTIPKDTATNYNVAIRYLCGLYPTQVHCIDLAANYMEEFNSGIIEGNRFGVHYNPLAYNVISTIIEEAISNYIYDNYLLFQKVPYYSGWPN